MSLDEKRIIATVAQRFAKDFSKPQKVRVFLASGEFQADILKHVCDVVVHLGLDGRSYGVTHLATGISLRQGFKSRKEADGLARWAAKGEGRSLLEACLRRIEGSLEKLTSAANEYKWVSTRPETFGQNTQNSSRKSCTLVTPKTP